METRPIPVTKKTTNLSRRFVVYRQKLQIGYQRTRLYGASHKVLWLTMFQCLCALAVLVGISFWSIPAALIVGGIGGIIVGERH